MQQTQPVILGEIRRRQKRRSILSRLGYASIILVLLGVIIYEHVARMHLEEQLRILTEEFEALKQKIEWPDR